MKRGEPEIALLACAEAVQQENFAAAEAPVKQITLLASSQVGAMRKVAAYFGEALARRVCRFRPQPDSSLLDAASADLHAHFYESCPYLKFAHFTANQAILEAFAGCRRVHVVDFGIKQGMQWPPILQALALRPGGPPSFRLTGVGPPQPDETDALQRVGRKLAQFAHAARVDFQMLWQWRNRLGRAGFETVHLGSNAYFGMLLASLINMKLLPHILCICVAAMEALLVLALVLNLNFLRGVVMSNSHEIRTHIKLN